MGKDLTKDVLMGMGNEIGCVTYHSCIPGVGVLGTPAGSGLPSILIKACMKDLAHPWVY